MEISIGEYCQFTLRGKMNLIENYGKFECLKVFDKKRITVFKLFDFYVEVIREPFTKYIIQADPITSKSLLQFYNLIG